MLRIGFVGIIRPLFKGDSPGAARRSLESLHRLGSELDFEVVTPSVTGNDTHAATGESIPPFAVSNLSAAEAAARQLQGERLDFLLIQHTTFSTGDLLVPLLHAAKRVGVWALPERSGGRGSSGPLPLNALCGLNMTLSFLEHPKVAKAEPVKWFYGEAEDEWFRARLEPTLAALRGLKALDGARILQIGGTAPAFYGIQEHPTLASVTVEVSELSELFEHIERISEREAAERAEAWMAEERLEAPREHLERAVRIESALLEMAEEGGYHALALRCWPELPESCGAMACGAVARLGDRERPTACEGDVMGALSMLALQGMSGCPSILLDLSDIDLTDNSLLFWHCGNAAKAWAANPGTHLTTHFNRDGVGVVRDMVLRPGPATGFRLLSGGSGACIVSGDFGPAEREGYDGVRGWLYKTRWNGERIGADAFVANVLDYRLPHHLAFGMGELTEGLNELCTWLGAGVLEARPLEHRLRS